LPGPRGCTYCLTDRDHIVIRHRRKATRLVKVERQPRGSQSLVIERILKSYFLEGVHQRSRSLWGRSNLTTHTRCRRFPVLIDIQLLSVLGTLLDNGEWSMAIPERIHE
jgi:hypothetical protein